MTFATAAGGSRTRPPGDADGVVRTEGAVGEIVVMRPVSRTPLEAIRKFCVICVGSPYDVESCGGDKFQNGGSDSKGVCHFYKYRMGSGRPSVKLIRKTCLWCMGDSQDFVRDCWTPDCALHPYRMGTNPNITEETREKRRQKALKHRFGRVPVCGLDS